LREHSNDSVHGPWFVGGRSKYVTGVALPVDAGFSAR